uniref:Uncharacterized protein n=1 Tax=Megaselia scalaris TaxID=36166 RepID=T1GEA9_MEGSC
MVCDFNENYAENGTCELKGLGRQFIVANLEADVKKPFKNISIHLKMFKFYNQFRPFLVDVEFNVCDAFNKKSALNFYGNTLMRLMMKYTNIRKCPISGHVFIKNFELKVDYFKNIMEDGKYRFNFMFFETAEWLANFTFYGEILTNYRRPKKI